MIKTDEQMKDEAILRLCDTTHYLEDDIGQVCYSEQAISDIAVALDHVARALLLRAEIELCKLRWGSDG